MSKYALRGVGRATVLAILWRFIVSSVISPSQAQGGGQVYLLTVEGAIDPWVDSYINRGIGLAEQDGAQAVLIILDTPGGTLGTMQNITSRMLAARVLVAVFVYPNGAWAASAGTFIVMAGNVAATAPGTSIGAAHPGRRAAAHRDECLGAALSHPGGFQRRPPTALAGAGRDCGRAL